MHSWQNSLSAEIRFRRLRHLTFEKIETLVMRRAHKTTSAWCALCGRKVKMFSPEDAAGIVKLNLRKIYQALEAGRIHFVELPEGRLLVCLDSLLRH